MSSSARLASASLAYTAPSGTVLVEVDVVVTIVLEDGASLPEPRYLVTLRASDDALYEGVDYLISRVSPSVDRWGWETDQDWGGDVKSATLTRGDDLWRLYCAQELELRSVEVDSDLVGRDEDFYDADIEPDQAWKAWFQAAMLSGATRECLPLRLVKAAHRALSDRSVGGEVSIADSWALSVITA